MSDTAPIPVFDYFSQVDLPTPTLSDAEVVRLFAETFGVEIDVRALGSQQDQNFRVFRRGSAEPLGVLKLSNPVFSEAEIDMQDAAAATVAARSPHVRIPKLVEGPRGAMSAWWDSSEGRIHARVIENIAGSTLNGSGYLSPAVVEGMGALSGAVSRSLADFTHPAGGRVLQWDLRHAGRVIDTLLPTEPDAEVRAIVQSAADAARAALAPVQDSLPIQPGTSTSPTTTCCAPTERSCPTPSSTSATCAPPGGSARSPRPCRRCCTTTEPRPRRRCPPSAPSTASASSATTRSRRSGRSSSSAEPCSC